MRGVEWSESEIASLLRTMAKHHEIYAAIAEHNRSTGKNRSFSSVETLLRRRTGKSPGAFLSGNKPRGLSTEDFVDDRVDGLVEILKRKKQVSVSELCDHFDCSPKRLSAIIEDAKAKHVRVEVPSSDMVTLNIKPPSADVLKIHRIPIKPIADEISFAVISDPHISSRFHRNECLVDFVDLALEMGVRDIYCAGDLFAGMNMYHGQDSEVVSTTMTGQLAEGVSGLPRRDDLTWHVIGGNHDASLIKAAGADIIEVFGLKRPDVKTYGYYSALLRITTPDRSNGIDAELFHPEKAGAYALSYHIQKEIESMPGGMKPQLFFCGHRHGSMFLPDYRGVAGFECGTFEDQNAYLKRKKIYPSIGGWIVKVGITRDGSPKSLTPTWVRYFHSRRGPIIVRDRREGDEGTIHMERRIGLPVGDSMS